LRSTGISPDVDFAVVPEALGMIVSDKVRHAVEGLSDNRVTFKKCEVV
jgi:hypothetical protein